MDEEEIKKDIQDMNLQTKGTEAFLRHCENLAAVVWLLVTAYLVAGVLVTQKPAEALKILSGSPTTVLFLGFPLIFRTFIRALERIIKIGIADFGPPEPPSANPPQKPIPEEKK